MVNLFRRFQQPLLIVLTIFTIISFVVLYNLPRTNNRTETVAVIYNRPVSQPEFLRDGRRWQVCYRLQMIDLIRALSGNARDENQAAENYAWNILVLRHEAEALGIMSASPEGPEREVLATQVQERITKMPAFQSKGHFDYTLYNAAIQNLLSPNGFTASDLEDMIIDDIRLEKVKAVVGGTVAPAPEELRDAYAQRNQKREVSVVRLKLDDFRAGAQVTDDDLKKLYESKKDSLKSPEKRKVKYVEFSLPKPEKDAKPLFGEERGKALEVAMSSALGLAQAMATKGADLAAEVAKINAQPDAKTKLEVKETPMFEEGKPPAELGGSAQVAEAAWKLTKEDPNSDAVGAQDKYFVLQLAGVEEAKPLTFDEAKPKLVEQLKEEKGQEALDLKSKEIRAKVEEAIKGGKSFAEAAAGAGAKAEKIPAFSPIERIKNDPDAQAIMRVAGELSEGQVSEFEPTAGGGVIVHLDKKVPIDEAAFEKEKPTLADDLRSQKEELIFRDWMAARFKAANYQPRLSM
jgi:hypothetical protein